MEAVRNFKAILYLIFTSFRATRTENNSRKNNSGRII